MVDQEGDDERMSRSPQAAQGAARRRGAGLWGPR